MLDSGATDDMVNLIFYFSTITCTKPTIVWLPTGTSVHVTHEGTVNLTKPLSYEMFYVFLLILSIKLTEWLTLWVGLISQFIDITLFLYVLMHHGKTFSRGLSCNLCKHFHISRWILFNLRRRSPWLGIEQQLTIVYPIELTKGQCLNRWPVSFEWLTQKGQLLLISMPVFLGFSSQNSTSDESPREVLNFKNKIMWFNNLVSGYLVAVCLGGCFNKNFNQEWISR